LPFTYTATNLNESAASLKAGVHRRWAALPACALERRGL